MVSPDGKIVFATLGDGIVFGEISILNIAGNKNGNRRTANIRSVGYTDLFVLSKDDLWDALKEYPEAEKVLMEKGKQMLLKDNMIDTKLAEEQEKEKESDKDRLKRLDMNAEILMTRFARLYAEFNSTQMKLKQRLDKLENPNKKRESDAIAQKHAQKTLLIESMKMAVQSLEDEYSKNDNNLHLPNMHSNSISYQRHSINGDGFPSDFDRFKHRHSIY